MVGSRRRFDVSERLHTLYHARKVNITLHVVSFLFWLYGLTVKSAPLVLIGLFIFDEMGHAYNYFIVHNRGPRFGLRMIPHQLLYASLIMPVLLKLFWLVLNSDGGESGKAVPGRHAARWHHSLAPRRAGI